jgi:hypothetical protein
MSAEQCHDRLRFQLSDKSGVLRFVEFEIVNASRCRGMEETLREYLLGRALADVDLSYLQGLACGGNGDCMHALIREMQKYQYLFVRKHESQSVTC